ncbi:hypothetical protein N0V90_000445 [Kalmusia sp. IMI 367209]|nr:hypothetical protein N0V90_000445 [Kalmusia sp. IMI 367209]
MSSEYAQIQVISRDDHTEQHLIQVPLPSTPLASSSIRVRPALLSLIVNTLSCASHPERKIGWWDVHALPSTLQAPFNDDSKYGRIGVFGWAEVIQSTLESIPVNARIYGFLPVATLPLDLQLKSTEAPGIYREITPYRATATRIYNTFEVHTAAVTGYSTSHALDAIAKPTFRLGYLLARYTFDQTRCLHPASRDAEWTPADADLTGAIVVLAAATSKTALSFAYMVNRPDQVAKPAQVIALTSSESASFAAATGWYSEVVTYNEAKRVARLGTSGRKVVIIDFGARENSAQRVLDAVRESAAKVQFLIVGGEQKKDPIKFTPEMIEAATQNGIILVHTGMMIESAEAILGEQGEAKLNEDYDRVWGEFKQHGFPGMKIHSGNGLEEYASTYMKMCDGEVSADTSHVFNM